MSALLECLLGKLPNLILDTGFCWCLCEQTEGRLWFGCAELNSSKKACREFEDGSSDSQAQLQP